MSSTKYIKEAIRRLELELGKTGHTLCGKPSTPMHTGYRPDLDESAVLEPEQANYYATSQKPLGYTILALMALIVVL